MRLCSPYTEPVLGILSQPFNWKSKKAKNILELLYYTAWWLGIQTLHFYLFELLSLCFMTLHLLTAFPGGDWHRSQAFQSKPDQTPASSTSSNPSWFKFRLSTLWNQKPNEEHFFFFFLTREPSLRTAQGTLWRSVGSRVLLHFRGCLHSSSVESKWMEIICHQLTGQMWHSPIWSTALWSSA